MTEISLRQLEYFAAVAETQSVTEAARICHVSQGAVSLALGQLEKAVGASLVIRRPGRGVSLTAEGKVMAARARLITEQVVGLRAAVSEVHNELAGRLVIGVFTTVAVHVIPHLADWFEKRHPRVELSFMEGSGPQLQAALFSGQSQLSVGYEAQFDDENSVEVLHEFHRQVMVSPEHPLAELETVSFKQLAPYPAALLNLEPALRHTLAEFHRYGVDPIVKWLFGNVPSIHSVVGRGLAYSLLMQPTEVSPEGRALVLRPLSDPTVPNSLVAATPRGVGRSAVVDEAVTALKAQWKEC
ncbi:LysR family transcriptional regulator [Glutamicibacter sp. MNS18]|uniref:LysR family transcriptional regulator n=1 Tax=Glutamicibacter sp. MNS18 TaxID=2989817 RepID=UPI002236A5B0|nr:LysR family transcriptional regulator [Glutamicibacter sp. MNS18]MCW4467141.1 LysR family transcriptional regulator [Glutamicibacter sp. MNS18]